MAERVGFASQRFAKLFAVKDMPQNALFTAISVVAHLSHPSHKYLLLTTVSRFTVWMVWMRKPAAKRIGKADECMIPDHHCKFRSIHPHSRQSESTA
jgi:hypothetical protein